MGHTHSHLLLEFISGDRSAFCMQINLTSAFNDQMAFNWQVAALTALKSDCNDKSQFE